MTRCAQCLLPTTKPDLWFREGTCAACWNQAARAAVDWEAREAEFVELLDRHDGRVVVPVSGGKDSHAIVLKLKEYGVRPLLVNARTCSLSHIGRRNLDNIGRLGSDLIEVAPDPVVRRRLNAYCLREVGDISWPEHVSIFSVPPRIAAALGYSLIVWGENPQNEYGGPELEANGKNNGRAWLEEFGGMLGLRVSELPIAGSERAFYEYPEDADMVQGAYLGYYFPWDGYQNALVAEAHGFERSLTPVQASGFDYENLDNFQTGIHDYFKFLKFGFGRATDIASTQIRHGYMTRAEGLKHIAKWDGKYPDSYLMRPLRDILDEIDMSVTEFDQIAERFTSRYAQEANRRDAARS